MNLISLVGAKLAGGVALATLTAAGVAGAVTGGGAPAQPLTPVTVSTPAGTADDSGRDSADDLNDVVENEAGDDRGVHPASPAPASKSSPSGVACVPEPGEDVGDDNPSSNDGLECEDANDDHGDDEDRSGSDDGASHDATDDSTGSDDSGRGSDDSGSGSDDSGHDGSDDSGSEQLRARRFGWFGRQWERSPVTPVTSA